MDSSLLLMAWMGLAGKLIVEMPTFDLWAQVQKFTGGIRIEGLFSRHGVDPAARSHRVKLHLSLMPPRAFHFHRQKRNAGPPLASTAALAESLPVIQNLDFSHFVKASIHEAVLDRMKSKGLECDADIAGLTASELELLLSGFIDDEEASWYVEIAQGAQRQQKRARHAAVFVTPASAVAVFSHKYPAVELSSKTHAFKWSLACPTALRRGQTHAQLIDSCWNVYAALGRRGEQWSPLLESQNESAREAFCRRLQLFEQKTISARISTLRRFAQFLAEKFPSAQVLSPPLEALYAFLKQVDAGGPTASQAVFHKLQWWKQQVGIPFQLEDALVAVWNRCGEAHQVQQRVPLSFPAFRKLCELAQGAFTNLAVFASFALLPLMACLRFAHMQRSADFKLDGRMFRATCLRGKSRKQGARPAFEWAVLLDAGNFLDVLRPAVNVMMDLQTRAPSSGFCMPDIFLGVSGRLDSNCRWGSSAMPMAKFTLLLKSVLSAAAIPQDEVALVSTYSLRRFLPSVAEVVRTPPEVARHLGNWAEAVRQSHHDAPPFQMAQLYANDRVLTAGHTKALLLDVVARTVHARGKEASLQTVRTDGWTWNRILCELVSQPSTAKHDVSQDPSQLDTIVSSPDSDSCSISSSSSNFSTHMDFAWFRLARGVAHLVKEHDKVAPIPWCRQTPFQHASFEWGNGVDSCLNICARCLACVPSHMSRAIRSLRQDGPVC